MALTVDGLKALAARIGNKVLERQTNLSAPLLGLKALEEEKVTGRTRIVNVVSSGLSTTGILQDGAQYLGAAGNGDGTDGNTPVHLYVSPQSYVGHVRVGVTVADQMVGEDDAFNLVEEQFSQVGDNLAQQLDRALINPVIGVATAAQAGAIGSGQFTWTGIADVRGFRQGQRVDIFEDTSASQGLPKASTARQAIASVNTVSLDGTTPCSGNVLFDVITNTAYDDTKNLCAAVYGSFSAAAGALLAVGLAQACEFSSGTTPTVIYGQSISGSEWSGNVLGSYSTSLTPARMRQASDAIKMRSGKDLRCVIMSPLAATEYQLAMGAGGASNAGGGTRFFAAGDKLDPFQKGDLTFGGAPVVIDPNCPSRDIFFIGKDAVKVGMWRKISAFGKDGGAEVSQTNFEYNIKCYGSAQLVVLKRNAIAQLKFQLTA